MNSVAEISFDGKDLTVRWSGVKEDFWGDLKRETLAALKKLLETMMEVEVQDLIGSVHWRHNPNRPTYRNGYYRRSLLSSYGYLAGLKVPRIRQGRIEFKLLKRYQRRTPDIDMAILEMFLAGVATRRVEEVLAPLYGPGRVSAGMSGNVGQSPIYTVKIDAVSPAAVTQLLASPGEMPGEIDLTWTAPGDDGWIGTLSGAKYRIRYSTDDAVDWSSAGGWDDWENRYEVSIPTDTPAMAQQVKLLTGLLEGTTYYVHLWTRDEMDCESAISNGATTYAQVTIVGIEIAVTEQDFGVVFVGNSTMTVTAISVDNTGNVNETYRIVCATTTAGTSWAPGGAASDDVFVVYSLFNSTVPALDDYGADDVVWSTYTLGNNSQVYTLDGSYGAYDISPSSAARNVWFRMDMPLTTETTYQQQIAVTIGAIEQ